jgi:hypothetical protein
MILEDKPDESPAIANEKVQRFTETQRTIFFIIALPGLILQPLLWVAMLISLISLARARVAIKRVLLVSFFLVALLIIAMVLSLFICPEKLMYVMPIGPPDRELVQNDALNCLEIGVPLLLLLLVLAELWYFVIANATFTAASFGNASSRKRDLGNLRGISMMLNITGALYLPPLMWVGVPLVLHQLHPWVSRTMREWVKCKRAAFALMIAEMVLIIAFAVVANVVRSDEPAAWALPAIWLVHVAFAATFVYYADVLMLLLIDITRTHAPGAAPHDDASAGGESVGDSLVGGGGNSSSTSDELTVECPHCHTQLQYVPDRHNKRSRNAVQCYACQSVIPRE